MKNLIQIQNELKVPKGNVNKFGNYKYRSAEDILEAVKPILLKYNARLILSDDIVFIGTKIFCKATATITIDSENISVNGFAETSEHKGMSAEQTTGTASSYSRKYALNGLFLIDETESDADSQAPQQPKPTTQTPAPSDPNKQWLNLINKDGGINETVKAGLEKHFSEGGTLDAVTNSRIVKKAELEYIQTNIIK